LGAESLAPQIGSVILLSVFFFTNFQLVVYIPKPAFSSVLCLAAIDIMDGWFVKSFQKTRSKVEWLVNPFIVIAAFSVGLLSAVFLGLALSTFFFVGSFYRSGVVKYAATGITMRSTIERPTNISRWLDLNGDQIQILVLQSFLFFGNATSVLNYVSTMFEDIDEEKDEIETSLFPPIPKVLVLDFSLVPGMDGSAVDVSCAPRL
jgi:SulP family sulfate permease